MQAPGLPSCILLPYCFPKHNGWTDAIWYYRPCYSASIKIQLKEESLGLFFDTNVIPLDPNMCDISLSDYRDYRAKIST